MRSQAFKTSIAQLFALREHDTLSLLDHNALTERACFVHALDACYFVVRCADAYRAFVCCLNLDLQNQPVDIQVIFIRDYTTLQCALDFVLQQYDIDARDSYEYFEAMRASERAA
jgi:hypothetical protein